MTIRRQKDVSFKKSQLLDEFRKHMDNLESRENYVTDALKEGFNILLIDQDVSCGKKLSGHLRGQLHSCKIYVCQSEFTALKVLKNNLIDVIVTEVDLQNYNGYDFAKCIRLLMHKDYPVVFYSQNARKHLNHYLNEMDNSYFIEDPFLGSDLSRLLRKTFKREKSVA